jgi:DNA-binding protein HU-beta
MVTKNGKSKHVPNEKINRKELARVVKAYLATDGDHTLTVSKIEKIFELMGDSIASYIRDGKEIFLSGLGSFVIQKRKATKRRNPRNGKEMKIPAKEIVKMKLFKSFEEKCATPSTNKTKTK